MLKRMWKAKFRKGQKLKSPPSFKKCLWYFGSFNDWDSDNRKLTYTRKI
jgi:hypothetical protein